jgi:hypothetical protein
LGADVGGLLPILARSSALRVRIRWTGPLGVAVRKGRLIWLLPVWATSSATR